MISLELAKQLKDAGLKWDPDQGWYPGIIEILQAISAAGWGYDLRGGWTDISRDIYQTWRFPGEPEESAARALLHILKEGE